VLLIPSTMTAIANWWRGSEIHRAASSGDLSKVLKHIESNQDLDTKDPDSHTPLSLAAKHGHFHVVERLLATGRVNPDSRNKLHQTPLHLASAGGHREVVKQLKDNSRVDLNSRDVQSETPLLQAAKNGHTGVVKELLAADKIDPDCKNKNGRTPLSQASEAGHQDVVKHLVVNPRVDVNAVDIVSDTALSLAAKQGHASVVKELLATNKVHPNTKNLAGQTPLSVAAEAGHLEAVEQLLKDTRVDVNTRDTESMTPLLYAVQGGHVEVSKKLLAAGAVASLTSSYGQAAQDLVREKLLSVTNEQDRMKYKRIKSILEAPPPITRRGSGQPEMNLLSVVETIWPPDSSYRRSGICKAFQARVEFHKQGGFQPWIAPVWDLLYGNEAPNDLVKWKRSYADWKWIHLPANNVCCPTFLSR
jgi:ankyrin repeat protein